MTLEEKYHRAIITLQAISQYNPEKTNGYFDEWSQARAFHDCRKASYICLRKLGENTYLTKGTNHENL